MNGSYSMKEAHDTNRAILDWAAKENPEAIKSWIEGELESGKYLIIPPALEPYLEQMGFSEKARQNIHISRNLLAENQNPKKSPNG